MAEANESYETLARRGAAISADIRGTAKGDRVTAGAMYAQAAKTPADKASFLAFLLEEGTPEAKARIHAVLRDAFLDDCEARKG